MTLPHFMLTRCPAAASFFFKSLVAPLINASPPRATADQKGKKPDPGDPKLPTSCRKFAQTRIEIAIQKTVLNWSRPSVILHVTRSGFPIREQNRNLLDHVKAELFQDRDADFLSFSDCLPH